MGSRSDNSSGLPGDGGSAEGLPDLPEEWGVIVVPDDLSALTDEVDAVRDELRRAGRRSRWQRVTDRPGLRFLPRLAAAGLRAPVLIISMAVLVTIASLFASAWPGPSRTPATQRTANVTDTNLGTLPALELESVDGGTAPIRGRLPAVILLTEGCDCDALVTATVEAVRPEITVITVAAGAATPGARTPPPANTPQAQGKTVRAMRDPTGQLRSTFDLGAPDGTAAVLIVNSGGDIVRRIPRTASIADYQPDLARL